MPQPNMKKEFRAELKILRANKRKTIRDLRSYVAAKKKELHAIDLDVRRAGRRSNTALNKLMRRIAIVEGRLS